ncbi:MAG: hypothetical protein F9K13_12170 [Candidatus Methylomirabilis oxygeniifera]|uniref:Zinc-regulated TonB-dependent outer membrane receptor n=1 Tax=Methylomirabilis oxygeniifera TaxID=671143 RepID=D5MGZ9_METO1|nr:MAG: hypothetical protein F9K13_12170 [Candidatus Methylomirabilis oxyfera]CBE69030.1 conserved exported protein of unknown function [Candidatus Methylomirabilis oxyfera]
MCTLSIKRLGLITLTFLAALIIETGATWAQVKNPELEALVKEVAELRRRDAEKEKKLEKLQREIEAMRSQLPTAEKPATSEAALEKALKGTEAPSPESALDKAVRALETPALQPVTPDLFSRQVGGSTFRLIDLSLDGLFAAGTSTKREASIRQLEGGDHDPRKRGFTVQNVELSLAGAVDPYLTGEAHIVYKIDPEVGDTHIELEEAFFTTQALPYGLQLKGGHFFTEFGQINPQHPHQWHWMDQPVINTRLFGPDGMRAPGVRLGWLTPLPWYSELQFGVQNANGETMSSFLANEEFFEERPIGGRPFVERDVRNLGDLTYLTRWVNSWNISETVTTKFGASGLFGANATGSDGHTRIYGADLKLTWRQIANFRGWPFFLWQSEAMGRDYVADRFSDDTISLPRKTLRDWGFYTQALYGFSYGWAAGLRYEYASGTGASVLVYDGRKNDPFRDDRHRISPLFAWQPSEFSRIRLQYNYDRADHLQHHNAHSVWLGIEFMYGAHAAHKY